MSFIGKEQLKKLMDLKQKNEVIQKETMEAE